MALPPKYDFVLSDKYGEIVAQKRGNYDLILQIKWVLRGFFRMTVSALFGILWETTDVLSFII
jgi:hypothetical protein